MNYSAKTTSRLVNALGTSNRLFGGMREELLHAEEDSLEFRELYAKLEDMGKDIHDMERELIRRGVLDRLSQGV